MSSLARHVVSLGSKMPCNRRLRYYPSNSVSFCLLLAALFIGLPIVGAQLQIELTPNPPMQCVPWNFTWTRGTPPSTLQIQPDSSNTSVSQQYGPLTSLNGSVILSTNVSSGTTVRVVFHDSAGVTWTDWFTIQPGLVDSCLLSSGVTTPDAPSATTSPSSTQVSSSGVTFSGTPSSGVETRSQPDVSTVFESPTITTIISPSGSKDNGLPPTALGGISLSSIVAFSSAPSLQSNSPFRTIAQSTESFSGAGISTTASSNISPSGSVTKDNSLPAAALGGVGAGATVFVVLVAVLVFWLGRSRKASVCGRRSKTPIDSEVHHRDEDSTGQRRSSPPLGRTVPTGNYEQARHTYVANRPGSSAPAMPARDSDLIIEPSQYGDDRRSSIIMVELFSSGRGFATSSREGPLRTDPVNLPSKYAELRAEAQTRRHNEAQRDLMELPQSECKCSTGTTSPQYDTEDVMSESTPSDAPPAYSM